MLLRLTSVKELSLLFILCRVSSTLVGFGGSSNTGVIFSPLTTSTGGTWVQTLITVVALKQLGLVSLTVVTPFASTSIVRLTAGDQCVNTQDCCKQTNKQTTDSVTVVTNQHVCGLTETPVASGLI